MIKIVLTAAVLGSVGSFAGLAIAQEQQGGALGREVSAQCAHRRVMPPDPRDGCVRQLRSDAQLGYAGSGSSDSQTSGGDLGPEAVKGSDLEAREVRGLDPGAGAV